MILEPVGKPTVRFIAVSEATSHLWAMAALGVLLGLGWAGLIVVIVSLVR